MFRTSLRLKSLTRFHKEFILKIYPNDNHHRFQIKSVSNVGPSVIIVSSFFPYQLYFLL